jgi:hypothetical protein
MKRTSVIDWPPRTESGFLIRITDPDPDLDPYPYYWYLSKIQRNFWKENSIFVIFIDLLPVNTVSDNIFFAMVTKISL